MVRLTDLAKRSCQERAAFCFTTEDAAKEIRARTGLEKGSLRVGASGSLAYHLLPLLIVSIALAIQRLTFTLSNIRATPQLLDAAERHEIDIALMRLPHDKTKLSITVLREEALVAALPKSHPLAGQATVKLKQLRDAPIYSSAIGASRSISGAAALRKAVVPAEHHLLRHGICTAAGSLALA